MLGLQDTVGSNRGGRLMPECPHGKARRCEVCRMEDRVEYHGVVDDEDVKRSRREADDEA